MKILLDTNFLLVPVQFKVDVFKELDGDLFTLDACINELEKMSKNRGKAGNEARAALALLKKKDLKIIATKEKRTVDKLILDYAVALGCAVATNDKELIKRLENGGVKVIRLRQKKIIVEE